MKTASGVRLVTTLATLGAACALILSSVSWATSSRIEENQAAYLRKSVLRVIPGAVSETPLKLADTSIFATYNDRGDFVAYAIVAVGQGFQDTITLVYGYNPNTQKLTGFRVLASRETPGLGDKIEKDDHFQQAFAGQPVNVADGALEHPLVLVKPGSGSSNWEVDAISGATISSRAVTAAISDSAQLWIPLLHRRYLDER